MCIKDKDGLTVKKIPVSKKVWRKIHQIKRDKKLNSYSNVIEYILNPEAVLKGEIVSDIQLSDDDKQVLKSKSTLKEETMVDIPAVDQGQLLHILSSRTWDQILEIKKDRGFDNSSRVVDILLDAFNLVHMEKAQGKVKGMDALQEIYDHIQELKTPQEHNHVNDISPEKQAYLLNDLSKQYENPTGADHKSKEYQDAKITSGYENVLDKTAKKVNVSDIDEKKEFICCPICYAIRPLLVGLDPDGNPLQKHEVGIEYKMVDGVLQRRFSGPDDNYLPFQIQTGGKVNVEESMAISTLRRLDRKLFDHILARLQHAYFLFGGRRGL